MTRWAYRIEKFFRPYPSEDEKWDAIRQALDTYGAEGWEVAGVHEGGKMDAHGASHPGIVFYLKRPHLMELR